MRKFLIIVLASIAVLSMNAQQKASGYPPLLGQAKIGLEEPKRETRIRDFSEMEETPTSDQKRNMVSRNSQDFGIIFTAPGEEQFYSVTSDGYYVYWSEILTGEYSGLTTINTDGKDVYIKNPLPRYKANTYVLGTKDDNKITVQLPQTIDAQRWTYVFEDYPEYSYDETDVYELNLMQRYYYEKDGVIYVDYATVTTDNFITYTIQEDGSIVLDLDGANYDENGSLVEYPEYILGVTYYTIDHLDGDKTTDPAWGFYGDWEQTYTISTLPDEVVSLPNHIEMESDWLLTSDEGSKSVSVGMLDDKIYIAGLSELVPDGVIYGVYDVESGQYIFPTAQNIGYYSEANEFIYIVGINSDNEFVDLIFDYDSDSKRLVSAQEQTMLENSYTDRIYYWESYHNPKFLYQTEEYTNANPANPIYNSYNTEYNAFKFTMPFTNINDYVIDTERIYYNVYANDQLYTFRADQGGFFNRFTYAYYDKEDTFTDITYAVYEYDYLYWYNNTLEISIPEEGIESVGVQVFYQGTDGILYRSDLVTGYMDGSYEITDGGSSGLHSLSDEKARGIVFYNLAGVRVDNPSNGLYIKRTIMSDGTVKTQKVVITQ